MNSFYLFLVIYRLHGLVQARQSDKKHISILERRVIDETRQKNTYEASLAAEKRARRAAEDALSSVPPPPPPVRQECTDACKSRRAQMEQDLKNLRREIKTKDER